VNLRFLLLPLLIASVTAAGPPKERWIYVPTNFQVDANADKVIALLERGAKVGYTHMLVADSKFSRLTTVLPNYAPNVARVKGVPDGELLKVSYYHTHVIYDGQVGACVEEPAFQEILRDQAVRLPALWGSRSHLMAHDEWRIMGWDESCVKSKLTPGGIAAKNVRFCSGLLEKSAPGGRILVWNDMFDPHHNAVKDYYLVNGTLAGSWEGLAPAVQIMNWNHGKRDESLAFFAGRGHSQVIAGFYDERLANVSSWLVSAAKVKNVKGFMYTTWRNDYSNLEAVAKILTAAGW